MEIGRKDRWRNTSDGVRGEGCSQWNQETSNGKNQRLESSGKNDELKQSREEKAVDEDKRAYS